MNPQPPTLGGSGHLPPDVLSDLLDDRLPADASAQATAHLARCASCRAERDALAQVVALGAHALARPAVPPAVWPLVAARTIHERAVRRHVLRSVRGPLLAAALVLCALAAWAGALVGAARARRDAAATPPAGAASGGRPARPTAAERQRGPDRRRLEHDLRVLRERQRATERQERALP